MTRPALALLLASAAVLPAGAALAQSSDAVTDLGTIGGYSGSSTLLTTSDQLSNGEATQTDTSLGYAISGDGSTVVGTSVAAGGHGHAFVWTAAGGMTDIGALFSGGNAIAEGVDNAGDVVVGFSTVSAGDWQAFRWTKAGGMVDLGAIGAGTFSFASAVSADGSVVVGGSYTSTTIDRAFRWTQAGGMQNLGTIGNVSGFSDAFGVSADGDTVVGESSSAAGSLHAFRWTQAGGMADLGTLGAAKGASEATAANSDGSVVVGQSIDAGADATHAFRWTAAAGMADLGTIGGAAGTSAAFAVDGAGDEVVGYSAFGGTGTHAFLWSQAAGMQDLNSFLANAGVKMTGITLVDARGVSSDGSFVTGSGNFPGASGEQAYIARVGDGAAGLTDLASLVGSVGDLELARLAQLLNNQLLSQVLLGLNEQISCGNCGGPYASLGSFDIGAHGRWGLGRDLTVLAGFSYGQQRNAGADTRGEVSVAASLRYDPVELGHSRPFIEAGVTASPWQDTVYTRTYANGAGVATASGESNGSSYGIYGRVGWVMRLSKRDELAFSGDLGQSWQHVGAYAEATGMGNPFNAVVPASTDSMANYGVSAQLTHLFGRRLEADVNLGVSRSFDESSGLDADVAPVGPIAAPNQDFTSYEAGGRLGWRLRKGWTVDAFINAELAGKLGNTAHGGFGLRVDF